MNDPVRVLHPITRLIVGGAQENTLFTASHLDSRLFEVEILSGPQTGSEGSLIEEARRFGVRLTILPSLVRQVSPPLDLRAAAAMAAYMRRRRFTIVHTHSSKAGILGRLAARSAGVPLVIHTIHGWSFHDYMHPLVRRMYILLERRMAAWTDALVTVSEHDIRKGLAARIGLPEQYHLIRSAIPLDEFQPPTEAARRAARAEFGFREDVIVIGTVGRFSPQKNPLDWVRVAGRIARAIERARFVLVGDGPLRPQVEELLAKEGLSERTVLTGLRRDVPHLLAAMDIFLITSLWEGLPRTVPEAMAMQLPVVATRADGTAEAIRSGQTGCLCAPGDLDGLAARCIELARDPELRWKMGLRAAQSARESFDLDEMIGKIEALYTGLLSRVD